MEMTARNKFKLAGLINISDAFLGVLMVVIIIAAAWPVPRRLDSLNERKLFKS